MRENPGKIAVAGVSGHPCGHPDLEKVDLPPWQSLKSSARRRLFGANKCASVELSPFGNPFTTQQAPGVVRKRSGSTVATTVKGPCARFTLWLLVGAPHAATGELCRLG